MERAPIVYIYQIYGQGLKRFCHYSINLKLSLNDCVTLGSFIKPVIVHATVDWFRRSKLQGHQL